ncbi:hypothetical protein [Alicyclobacillus contaminans]|uniref:hypothetical protein n=1 Tax=Alicyclobacillus contaminans TaxID=392016 RepID=UPI00042760DE|nr:hypothetical protein [Alicyclobacillus contaminans]
MIHRTHCMRFVGQHVVFATRDGIHHGILHSVTANGIHIRPVSGSTTRLAAGAAQPDVEMLPAAGQQVDAEQAWWPFFFFPFLALAWLLPWAWWW